MRHIKTPELLWPALRQYRHNTDNSPNINHPENGFVTGFDYDETVVVVKRLEQQLAELREALTRIRDCDWVITLPDRMDAVREIAREALDQSQEQTP